jgi:hypothetical protein
MLCSPYFRGESVNQGLYRRGHEADHSPPSSAENKNGGVVLALPHTFPSWGTVTYLPVSVHFSALFSRPVFLAVYATVIFFLVLWGGVRLCPLGTSATIWPVVSAPIDKWVWSNWWNENWQGKLKYSEKTCPIANLSTTNPTLPDLGSNAGRRGGKLATQLAN